MAGGLAGLLAWAALASCSEDPPRPPTATETPTPTPTGGEPVTLTFAVYGPDSVVRAYRTIAAAYESKQGEVTIEVRHVAAPTTPADEVIRELDTGAAPDLFLADRHELPELLEAEALQPVDDLLASRRVNFADGFYRGIVLSFSDQARLQCMPIDVSPLVVYYNKDLVRLGRIAPDPQPPSAEEGWTLPQFEEAARQASGRRTRGVYVPPTLDALAPFVWSAGGDVVDDDQAPTTLTLSEDDAAAGVAAILAIMRDNQLTFSRDQIERRSALRLFQAGRLGMLVADRSVVPALRATDGVDWDVMPLPRIGRRASSVNVRGVCITSTTPNYSAAADFLAYAISDEGAAALAATGYVVPANANVVFSDVFTQPGLRPASPLVYDAAITSARVMPLMPRWTGLNTRLASKFEALAYAPLLDLEEALREIDRISAEFLVAAEQE